MANKLAHPQNGLQFVPVAPENPTSCRSYRDRLCRHFGGRSTTKPPRTLSWEKAYPVENTLAGGFSCPIARKRASYVVMVPAQQGS